MLILCNSYGILNYVIGYTNFKSIAFVFIPFLTQPDTDSLDSRFSNESDCIVEILGCELQMYFAITEPLIYTIFDSCMVGCFSGPFLTLWYQNISNNSLLSKNH